MRRSLRRILYNWELLRSMFALWCYLSPPLSLSLSLSLSRTNHGFACLWIRASFRVAYPFLDSSEVEIIKREYPRALALLIQHSPHLIGNFFAESSRGNFTQRSTIRVTTLVRRLISIFHRDEAILSRKPPNTRRVVRWRDSVQERRIDEGGCAAGRRGGTIRR